MVSARPIVRCSRIILVTEVVVSLVLLNAVSCAKNKCEYYYDAEHIFTLKSNNVAASFKDRPTPTIAVDGRGRIAFPIKPYTIGLFDQHGNIVGTISDSSNVYPHAMLFDDEDILQVLTTDEESIIKYYDSGRVVIPITELLDWWRYADREVADFLENNNPKALEIERDPLSNLRKFNQYIEVIGTPGEIYINGSQLSRVSSATGKEEILCDERIGELFAVPCESILVGTTLENYAEAYSILIGDTCKIVTSSAEIHDTLPSGFENNYPESNKFNLRQGWSWQRGTANIYKVAQLPTGFYFFKIEFECQR